ncbi:psbP-like protein 1, chloroplastic isoform X1 [Ziziphus jujuba]|uniref:PsbP-like protein 1, chloroplastic isoform X1 n=1 Tax=Ziziphus jujuba TaxID=326968 RepID=A0ABM4AG61_ZIZJJ|nr:psbP-like protein 1, chloroplastic isoform X1 [Ziziphus jujuba]
MTSLQNSTSINQTLFLNSFPQWVQLQKHHATFSFCRRRFSLLVRSQQASPPPPSSTCSSSQDRPGRRQVLAAGIIASWVSLVNQNSVSFAAENKKGFMSVLDKKDGYSFLYPFGWQEVVIDGQDKVFKDVIEPLENVSVNLIPTNKQDIREFGPPKEVAETLIKKVLAPPNQKTKLINATEHDVDGKAYYTFEFVAQAPNYTRHALSTISIGNGKFYTLTTGANERRWGKMQDKLQSIVDSFKIFNV